MWREYLGTLREYVVEYAKIALDHAGMWREYLAMVRAWLSNWRDYAPLFGPVAALVNAFLAIAVALLPLKSPKTKLRIGIAAVVLGVLAIGATMYSEYLGHRQQEQQRAYRVDTRDQLDALIVEGTALVSQIGEPQQALPVRQADQWAQKAEALLSERLGNAYVARFRSDIVPLVGESTSVPGDRLGYWRAVRNRVVQLQRIAAEFPK